MGLALATDSAYPYNFAQAPAGCVATLGYVGRSGYTPHVWTRAEVDEARSHGLLWWPIVTGISLGPTNALDGHINAETMITNAPLYGVSKTDPVFCDLEPDALHADMAGAAAMVAAFKSDMRAAGYTRPYVYSTNADFIDWVADWTNVRPAILPAGRIGFQYGGGTVYDLSVFDPSLLLAPTPPTPPEPTSEVDMLLIEVDEKTVPAGTQWPGIFLTDGVHAKHCLGMPSIDAYRNAGIKLAVITYQEFQTYTVVSP